MGLSPQGTAIKTSSFRRPRADAAEHLPSDEHRVQAVHHLHPVRLHEQSAPAGEGTRKTPKELSSPQVSGKDTVYIRTHFTSEPENIFCTLRKVTRCLYAVSSTQCEVTPHRANMNFHRVFRHCTLRCKERILHAAFRDRSAARHFTRVMPRMYLASTPEFTSSADRSD